MFEQCSELNKREFFKFALDALLSRTCALLYMQDPLCVYAYLFTMYVDQVIYMTKQAVVHEASELRRILILSSFCKQVDPANLTHVVSAI